MSPTKPFSEWTAAEILAEKARRDRCKEQGIPFHQDPRPTEPEKPMVTHMTIELLGAPRTKKNSTTSGQPARPFRDYKKLVLEQLKRADLPQLAPIPYNLSVQYYVDRPGERGDLVGFLQATQDLLQNANIIEDDKWFRGLDGCRVHTIDEPGFLSPRAVITISPLNP